MVTAAQADLGGNDMKLLTFYARGTHSDEKLHLGVQTERGVLDVTAAADQGAWPGLPRSIGEAIESWNDGAASAQDALQQWVAETVKEGSTETFLNEQTLHFGPVVPNPGKIICVGANYRKHAEETGLPIPEYPVLFNKYSNTLAAHGEFVPLPTNAEQFDYEAELVMVIGKRAKHVTREEALGYVFGYCGGNDVSARDLQFRTGQWLLGKNCDRFGPIGPYLVTADEVPDANALGIRCRVNGEIRQNSSTADMIFACDTLVSYISDYMTLEPGDIIFTGTPEGVILGHPEEKRVWLKPGDEVVVEVDGLGELRNRMSAE